MKVGGLAELSAGQCRERAALWQINDGGGVSERVEVHSSQHNRDVVHAKLL